MTIEELLAVSGDCHLIGYRFTDGVLTVTLQLFEIDCRVQLQVSTDTVQGSALPAADQGVRWQGARLELVTIPLPTHQGYYVAPSDFGRLMQHSQAGLQLAYGRRASEVKYLFSLVGYGRLVSCLVADLDRIMVVSMAS